MKNVESKIQKEIVRTLRILLPHGWLVVGVSNNPRSRIGGAIEKAMGLTAGLPDLALYGNLDGSPFTGFLEVKTAKGRVSEAQRDMHDRLMDANFKVAVVRSVDDAIATIKKWGLPLRISA
jgi:hypothetical protein